MFRFSVFHSLRMFRFQFRDKERSYEFFRFLTIGHFIPFMLPFDFKDVWASAENISSLCPHFVSIFSLFLRPIRDIRSHEFSIEAPVRDAFSPCNKFHVAPFSWDCQKLV